MTSADTLTMTPLATESVEVEKESACASSTKQEETPSKEDLRKEHPKALKVLFLSSDTGGGHRASAESLAAQFQILFPGSTYDLLDLATESYLPPYNSIVSHYKHLSANPQHWKLLYGISNSRFMERAVDTNIKVMTVVCERSIRRKIKSYEPDVVVSVHPLQTSVPILSCAKISHETGKHLPMFTVVTDLGSAHCTWFANGVERMFVGSTQIYDLAKERGKVPDEKLVLLGLPIRNDFAVEASKLGDRMSDEGKAYQREVRQRLELPAVDRKTLLVMGGGEGVGSLSNIVDALYYELVKQGIDAVILVVCGRNETLKSSLADRDWQKVFQQKDSTDVKPKSRGLGLFPPIPLFSNLSVCGEEITPVGCIEAAGVTKSIRRILSSGSLMHNASSPVFIPSPTKAIEEEKKEEKPLTDGNEQDDSKKSTYKKSNSIGPIAVHGAINTEEGEPSVPETYQRSVLDNEDNDILNTTPSIEAASPHGKVDVVGLGFVTNMAEYMVAADVLISKAGPGTISEAAALSLPVMLTSFLPGQEEGNVDYVTEGGFGSYCHDSDTQAVAEEVAVWLMDESKLTEMSKAAKLKGAPYAARDIVQQIGDSTLKWREINEENEHKAQEEKDAAAAAENTATIEKV